MVEFLSNSRCKFLQVLQFINLKNITYLHKEASSTICNSTLIQHTKEPTAEQFPITVRNHLRKKAQLIEDFRISIRVLNRDQNIHGYLVEIGYFHLYICYGIRYYFDSSVETASRCYIIYKLISIINGLESNLELI